MRCRCGDRPVTGNRWPEHRGQPGHPDRCAPHATSIASSFEKDMPGPDQSWVCVFIYFRGRSPVAANSLPELGLLRNKGPARTADTKSRVGPSGSSSGLVLNQIWGNPSRFDSIVPRLSLQCLPINIHG